MSFGAKFSPFRSLKTWEDARIFFEKSTKDRDLRFMSQPFLMGGHG